MLIRVARGVVEGEGWRSAFRRVRERVAEETELRSRVSRGRSMRPRTSAVLNVLGTMLLPRIGGVQAQLASRLREESKSRVVSIVHPGRDGFVLQQGNEGVWASWPLPVQSSDMSAAVATAIDRTGASMVHLEECGGAAVSAMDALSEDIRLVISVHDFGMFCQRPHLFDETAGAFCHYSTNGKRCGACLAAEGGTVTTAAQAALRDASARVLARAERTVFPSDFLRRQYEALFPRSAQHAVIVEPGILPHRPLRTRRKPLRRVALVGSVQRHKGSAVASELVRATTGVEWRVYGGGAAEPLQSLRDAGAHVHGFYHHGDLPYLLERDSIAVTVIASIVPETFCMTLSESWAAGVPVVAFDIGAVADRVRARGGGLLVPIGEGAGGLRAAVLRMLEAPLETGREVPLASGAAARVIAMYASAGVS